MAASTAAHSRQNSGMKNTNEILLLKEGLRNNIFLEAMNKIYSIPKYKNSWKIQQKNVEECDFYNYRKGFYKPNRVSYPWLEIRALKVEFFSKKIKDI